MTETAEAKVSLIDDFKALTTKQWIAIIGAFVGSALLITTGAYQYMCLGYLLIAVVLYMVPHITGVSSPKIKAVVGAVFIASMLIFGTVAYDGAIKDSQRILPAAPETITDMYIEDGTAYAYCADGGLDLYVLSAPVTEVTFGVVSAYDYSRLQLVKMTYSDGVYTGKVDLLSGCFQVVEIGEDISQEQKQFLHYYTATVDNGVSKTGLCFIGAAILMAIIGGIYFVMLIFSELMRRSARKTRAKMEAEGRLYPKGYSKCKECGTMVLPGEITCRKCGAPIEVPEELKVHKKDFFQCSECGTEVPMDAKVCPKCGATFDEKEETEIKHADGTVDVSTESFECSECGKKVPANAKKCPYCGAEFDEDE